MKLLSFLHILTTSWACAAEALAEPDFSEYPEMKRANDPNNTLADSLNYGGFPSFVDQHHALHLANRRGAPLLLFMSFLDEGGGSARQYLLTPSGQITWHVNVYFHAIQADRRQQLSDKQLAAVKDKIAGLPKVNTYPKLPQLAIVSFREGGPWITRSCRAEDLQGIQELLDGCLGFSRRR